MELNSWTAALLIFLGILIEKFWRMIAQRISNPYSWSCGACRYSFRTNNEQFCRDLKAHHISEHGF